MFQFRVTEALVHAGLESSNLIVGIDFTKSNKWTGNFNRIIKLPLSIVLVGVGDGPWDMMREFDDNVPAHDLDNLQLH
ncbi:putative copine [Helianthus annuus]|uniref:Copine n=1 Tax=Helianthus annuus TaxID=4232 RepID=A0A9K3E2R9_HELAN|nr:putative copine [Helianthus annuus]KAJ0452415.1 putative copine [Helianthus annuus]KAJ0474313.1 putative copine [Helianthus annuus]KAJ0649876.1 putative copine [Helianthus annuus]KAJ0653660.1 putative copine [Helianthus annuus]